MGLLIPVVFNCDNDKNTTSTTNNYLYPYRLTNFRQTYIKHCFFSFLVLCSAHVAVGICRLVGAKAKEVAESEHGGEHTHEYRNHQTLEEENEG